MPSLEGLALANQVNQANTQGSVDNNNMYQQQEAAKKASDLFKAGDVNGAYSVLAGASPEFAMKIAPQIAQYNPDLAKKLAGAKQAGSLQSQGQLGSGSIPVQVAKIGAEAKIAAAEARAKQAEDALHYQKNGYTGNTDVFTKQGQLKGTIGPDGNITPPTKTQNKNLSSAVADSSTDSMTPPKPELKINQEIDSNGQVIDLNTKQLADIAKNTQVFNKETKPLVDIINQTSGSEKLLDLNYAGSQLGEKIKTIRGLYGGGRIPQQLIQQYGNGSSAGFETQLQNWATEAAGGGLGKQARENMFKLNQALQADALEQYDSLLKQRAGQVGAANHIDPYVVKQRFASEGPTTVQQIQQKVKSLPPDQQAAFNWAHENALDPRAKVILQKLGLQ